MKMTVLDLPVSTLVSDQPRLASAIERETRFGMGAAFKQRRQHAVMDDDWRVTALTATMKDKAWSQLGTSGSGNHFVEFGTLTVTEEQSSLALPEATSEHKHGSGWNFQLPAGTYLALLTHSGSRGTGASVCDHYSKLALSRRPYLPKDLQHLEWLDMSSNEGQEY